MRRVSPLAILLSLLSLVLSLTSACGSDPDTPETQPVTDATTLEVGRFDDLPVHPRSEPVGERNEENGAIARSYKVVGASAEEVLEYYSNTLVGLGWTQLEAVEQLGRDTYRGDWSDDEFQLRVSATDAPTLSDDDAPADQVVTQYSLRLEEL